MPPSDSFSEVFGWVSSIGALINSIEMEEDDVLTASGFGSLGFREFREFRELRVFGV